MPPFERSRQVRAGVRGLGHRGHGGRGVDVDRRGVELEFGLEAAQVEAHDAADGHSRDPSEDQVERAVAEHAIRDRDELAPLARLEDQQAAFGLDRGGAGVAVDEDRERHSGGRPALLEGVGRPGEARVDAVCEDRHRHDLRIAGRVDRRVGRVQRALAVGRVDRGGHHPAEGESFGRLDREVGRHAPDVGADARLLQQGPEGPSGAVRLADVVLRELPVAPQLRLVLVALGRGRPDRRARDPVAVDEVVDPVPAGVPPGDEVRPGHRALRRRRGPQRVDAALARQLGEVRHPLGIALDHVRQDFGVHPVDA